MANGHVWEKLWKVHVANKIKVFGWIACQNILLTDENLVRRHIIDDDRCSICQRYLESVIHALWECSAA